MKFIKDLFSAIGELLIKTLSSRKAIFQIVSKLFTLHLILNLQNETHIVAVFAISTIADFAYFGIITFEAIDANINIGKSNG